MPRTVPGTTTTPRREQTKQRLVDAAMAVVARRGFHAASVDEIAAEAGLSVGALYSNFSGKDDLFFAVFQAHVDWFREQVASPEFVARCAQPSPTYQEQFLVFVEFWAYAVRKPKLKKRLTAQMREFNQLVAQTIGERVPGLPASDRDAMASVVIAAARGMQFQQLVDPDPAAGTALRRAVEHLFSAR